MYDFVRSRTLLLALVLGAAGGCRDERPSVGGSGEPSSKGWCDPFGSPCGEGLSCYAEYPWLDSWRCLPSGDKRLHEVCDAPSACTPGQLCTLDDKYFDISQCFQFCDPKGAQTCGPGQTCLPEPPEPSEGPAGAAHPYGLCFSSCADPVANDCPSGFTCIDLGADEPSLCFPAGARPLGADCDFDQAQCAAGLQCASGRCATPCAAEHGAGCPPGQVCVQAEDTGAPTCAMESTGSGSTGFKSTGWFSGCGG